MSAENLPGAAPEDWLNLILAGLLEDLLPVVMDQNAPVSQRSALVKHALRGKVPSRYTHKREVIGIPGWTKKKTTQAEAEAWASDGTLGVCVQTRNVRALDIDIEDAAEARAVVDFIRAKHPDMPLRGRANSSKALLAFRYQPGEQLNYRNITTSTGVIELLGTGKQFVAAGTHTSGARYVWEHGTPDYFPELSDQQLIELWDGLVVCFADPSKAPRTARGALAPPKPRRGVDAVADDVVDFLILNGWARQHRRDGGVDIYCPFEDQHTTGDSPSATTYFPAGVGGFERGHFRCLHAHCAGRSDDEFLASTGYTAAQFAAAQQDAQQDAQPDAQPDAKPAGIAPDAPLKVAWQRNKQGKVMYTINNVMQALQHPEACGARLSHDAFRSEDMIQFEGEDWRPFTDEDCVRIWALLERNGFEYTTRSALLREALRATFQEHTYDPAIEWASSLSWDGVPRVAEAMHKYFGVSMEAAKAQGLRVTEQQLHEYAKAVSLYLFTALAGRCMEPGCQADLTVILIGEQGTGKTQSVKALAPFPDAVTELDLNHLGPDSGRKMRGKLLVELAELRGLATRDAETVKAWLSATEDQWVPKYRERAITAKRRAVFIGTGNDPDIINDPTGSRRFLPVPVGPANLDGLKADRDQLWAEAIALWAANGVLYEEAERLARGMKDGYTANDVLEDPWETVAHTFAQAQREDHGEHGMLYMADFLRAGLNIAEKDQSVSRQRRAGRALRKAGFVRQRKFVEGRERWGWVLREQA